MPPQVMAGMITGAAVMFFFGTVWLLLGLYMGRSSPAWLRIGVLVAGLALAASIWIMGARVSQLTRNSPPLTSEEIAVGHQVGRRFGWITGLEGAAIFLAVVLLRITHRPDYILPAIALTVGLHFFPVASLFGAPIYYVTGALGCCVGLAGFFSSDARLRSSIVGLSFGLLLWLTCAAVLIQLSKVSAV